MSTTSRDADIRQLLDSGNLNKLAAAARRIRLGTMLSRVEATFTGLSDVAGQDITTATAKAAATIDGITLATGENLPPIGQVVSLRTTAGTLATHGTHIVGDVSATALVPQADSPGVATLSADGKTLTFQAGVTAFVIHYYPREYVDLDTEMVFGAP